MFTGVVVLALCCVGWVSSELDCDGCVRVCCSGATCETGNFSSFSLDIKLGSPCEKLELLDDEKWYLEDGKVYFNFESDVINRSEHCLHLTPTDNNGTRAQLFSCDELATSGDIEKQLHKSLVRVIGTSISLPLLIVTLIVLWHLKQFKSNHGKCLMCHILSLILLYTFLILDRMDPLIMKIAWLCEFSGYMMYISILFCIFWLNVMCYDIWKTFRYTRNPHFPRDNQKFYIYLFYGFGLPSIITIVLAIIDETTWFPEYWRPQIGKSECFLINERHIEFFYLYLPMSLILIVNVILYSITAYKIYTVQNDKLILSGKIERRRAVSCNPIRLRFLLYLRLFLLMGLTWSMEAVSWIFDANSTSFFIVSDVANSIHGFVIFGLFVCRSSTYSVLTKQKANSRQTSSMILGKLQDSKRNSLNSSNEFFVKFLKEKHQRSGNG